MFGWQYTVLFRFLLYCFFLVDESLTRFISLLVLLLSSFCAFVSSE